MNGHGTSTITVRCGSPRHRQMRTPPAVGVMQRDADGRWEFGSIQRQRRESTEGRTRENFANHADALLYTPAAETTVSTVLERDHLDTFVRRDSRQGAGGNPVSVIFERDPKTGRPLTGRAVCSLCDQRLPVGFAQLVRLADQVDAAGGRDLVA